MFRLLAATISGSVVVASVGELGAVGLEISLAALSNSFLASPMDFASSGSFCGPQRKTIKITAITINHSYPTRAINFHNTRMRPASYKQ